MSKGPEVAVLGGSFSGNKGAASMVYAVWDGVHRQLPAAEIRVFSPYPGADRRQQESIEIVSFTPRDMVVRVLPSALVCLLTLRRWRPRRGPAGLLARSDAALDVSGISFMDGRGLPTLIYNTLLVFLPWAFGVPIIKVAQALGPFQSWINRAAATWALRRVAWVGLRGRSTAENVAVLGLTNAEPAADVAFLLEVGAAAEEAASTAMPLTGEVTLVAPSAVVQEACDKDGIDYLGRMIHMVDGLAAVGHRVVLIAHSARATAPPGRTNDLPVCRAIAQGSSATLIDREIDARELRALIGRARLLVTSRFHGMISGLATRTPTFVVGWSHKYREVLDEFGLDEWAVDFRRLTDDALIDAVQRLDADASTVQRTMEAHLPTVRAAAQRNLDEVATVLGVGRFAVVTDLSPVLENDLCIGCGACVAADPTLTLELHAEEAHL